MSAGSLAVEKVAHLWCEQICPGIEDKKLSLIAKLSIKHLVYYNYYIYNSDNYLYYHKTSKVGEMITFTENSIGSGVIGFQSTTTDVPVTTTTW